MTQKIYYELTRQGVTPPSQLSPGIFRWYSDQNFTVNANSIYIYNTGVKVLLPNDPDHYLIPIPSMMLGVVKRYWAVNNNAIIIVQFTTDEELQIMINNTTANPINVTDGMGILDFAMVNLDTEPVKIMPGDVTQTHINWGH